MKSCNRFFKVYLLLLCSVFSVTLAQADDTKTVTKLAPTPEQLARLPLSDLADYQPIQTCPPPDKLFVNDMLWAGPNQWSSFYQSFMRKVDTFLGAHWVGVDVGKVICIYGTNQANYKDFPVTLENSAFISKPSGARWGFEIQGVENCISPNVADCPFKVAPKGSAKVDYKDLLDIKSSPDNNKSLPRAY